MAEHGSADRLPLPASLSPEQQRAVDRITSGPRGGLFGPFVPLLRAPELMTRVQLVGEYLRFESELPDHLRELVILLVARDWDQDFEWGHHVPMAREAGLGEDVIAAVAARGAPTGPPDVCTFWRLVIELGRDHAVSDDTFADAVMAAGDVAVVEAIVTVGYYTTLAMTMNAARTTVPDNYERLP
ncbi:carboxymuconolactone decarboxylase family protein [Mycolicibacterium goodii]|uniref:Carboxymuconolactone decarboxylase-like domain-containing protein n=1 Tax=Mycolicibacterium goodii TaxID=134601 RepID=A0A0K0X7S5_MYCGD|nr:hypothetical protein AFA91_17615 [Mycolicibacterium goodii]